MVGWVIVSLIVIGLAVVMAVIAFLGRGKDGSTQFTPALLAGIILLVVLTAIIMYTRMGFDFGAGASGLPTAPTQPPSFATPNGGNSIGAP